MVNSGERSSAVFGAPPAHPANAGYRPIQNSVSSATLVRCPAMEKERLLNGMKSQNFETNTSQSPP